MKREPGRELLDNLPEQDPLACGSRRDLRRLNFWMGHGGILARALLQALHRRQGAVDLVELGSGDGFLLLDVARRLGPDRSGTRVTLLDRQQVITNSTLRDLTKLGWQPEVATRDALEWCAQEEPRRDGIVSNLFLHHFQSAQLKEMFTGIARKCEVFVGLEPRRNLLSLTFSRMVGLIGCNSVTRHDAPMSVRAGFHGRELSHLWWNDSDWDIEEKPAGIFSHLFVARRRVARTG